ncbi:sensor domain-containing diguanylate cyclase [Ferrimonas lipolytica]|uniref:diguanylate cyclase n=1 Tax=Ferrimonas lipolytica TaxID=2724191 RepID=A0A6H1U908_9GAMM|nr:GGDEF domain-containing protein [Ferrimonas lipolytica]QIZ75527.1 GGDEF domain-containing protein [Ferrimonas lipolytica]
MLALDRFLLLLLGLLACAVVVPMYVALPPAMLALLPWLPLGTMAVALLLSQIYQQGRMGFVILLSLLNYGIAIQLQQHLVTEPPTQSLYWLWALSAPVLLQLITALAVPLVFHRRAIGHWLLIVIAMTVALWLWHQPEQLGVINPWMQHRSLALVDWSPAPLIILAIQLIIVMLSWVNYLLNKSHDLIAIVLAQAVLLLSTVWIEQAAIVALLATTLAVAHFILVLGLGHQLAFIDELTNIPGRRALNMALARLGKRYTIAMVDIDHFKKFNDTHGHDVGDEVLQMVAQQINNVGAGGKAYRYGGEEFSVVFAGKDPKQCQAALEQIRTDIADYRFVVRSAKQRPNDGKQGKTQRGAGGGKTVQVTISLGVANRTAKRNDSDSVFKAADNALYRAKKAGRNCLKLASSS